MVSAVSIKYRDSETKASAPTEPEIVDALEHGKSIVSILSEHGILAVSSQLSVTKPLESVQDTSVSKTAAVPSKLDSPSKQKQHRVVDRRRTRAGGSHGQRPISEEEEELELASDSDAGSSISSDDSLSVLSEDLGEDDLELLDSLSDSSSSEPEDEGNEQPPGGGASREPFSGALSTPTAAATGLLPNPVKKTGKRQIILAASFNMAPGKPKPEDTAGGMASSEAKARDGHPSPLLPTPSAPQASSKASIDHDLAKSTETQALVSTACRLVAEESGLMALRVFVYWLQSYPIIIATCTQVGVDVVGMYPSVHSRCVC